MKKPMSYRGVINWLARSLIKSRIEQPTNITAELFYMGQTSSIAKIYGVKPFECLNDFTKTVNRLQPKLMTPEQIEAIK